MSTLNRADQHALKTLEILIEEREESAVEWDDEDGMTTVYVYDDETGIGADIRTCWEGAGSGKTWEALDDLAFTLEDLAKHLPDMYGVTLWQAWGYADDYRWGAVQGNLVGILNELAIELHDEATRELMDHYRQEDEQKATLAV